jgi:hypothetical protein
MKAKLPLITLSAAGAAAGILIFSSWWHLSSDSARKSSSPVARDRDRGRAFPAVSKEKANDSARDKARDLSARILDALKAGEPLNQGLVFGDLLRDLVKEDPESAARLAGSLAVGPLREEMMRRLAQYWAESDATGARRWAEKLVDGSERDAALTDVCFQMAQADPRQATLLADQYQLEEQQGAPLENLAMQWAVKDLTSAIAWVKERPEGPQKDAMLARVAMVMAKTSPAEAAEMVATQLPEGEAQTESVISIIHQWAVRDLPGARAWTGLFPEGPLRERALGELQGIEQYQSASDQSKQ